MDKKKWIESDSFLKRSLATFGYSTMGYLIVLGIMFLCGIALGLLGLIFGAIL